MVPQNKPYQIQELSENGTLKFIWIFPLLPVDVSYKMEDKYSFYGANKIKGYRNHLRAVGLDISLEELLQMYDIK